MALPPLETQIRFVDSIVLAKAIKDQNGKFEYMVEEIFKSRYNSIQPNELLKADLSIFLLLGYKIENGQHAIVLLAEKRKGGFDCIDFLPVSNGFVEYGIDDATVHRRLSIEELRKLVTMASSSE